jgi:hypothetical protein
VANEVAIVVTSKDQTSQGFQSADRGASKLGGTFGKMGDVAGKAGMSVGKMGGAVGLAAGVVGGAVIGAGLKVVDMAGKLELMGKKSQVVFGDQIGRVDSWAKANANAMGLTKREATGLAAGFADLLIPMGFTRKQSADMSTEMIGLSGALAEWSGGTKTAAEVSGVLSDAMMGERDALKGLGISISQAEVDAKALEMGLGKNAVNMNAVKTATVGLKEAQAKQAGALKEHGKGSLEYEKATAAIGTAQDRLAKATKGSKAEISDQAQALATQQLILEKSKDAQTAFADGAGSLARKTAESKAKLADMGQTLLVKVTPVLTKIAGVVLSSVIPALEKFGGWLQANRFKIAEAFVEVGLAVTGLVKTFGPAFAFMNKVYLDFVGDMINGAVAAFGWVPGVGPKLKVAQDKFNSYRDTSNRAFDAVISKSKEWNTSLQNMKTEIKLKADKADLDAKLAAAKEQLKNPALTATKRAQLTADISALQRRVNDAQNKINSLQGKTVTITYWQKILGTAPNVSKGVLAPGHQAGGPVRGFAAGGSPSGTFVVGERGPELLSMSGGTGHVSPAGNTRRRLEQGSGPAQVLISIDSGGAKIDDFLMELLRKSIRIQGGNVQLALGKN